MIGLCSLLDYIFTSCTFARMEKNHLKDVKKMWKCLKACFDHNVFAVCESESWKKMHRCWNGNIKLSHGENLCASHKYENFRRKILFIQYPLRLLLWLEKNGQQILIAIWQTNLRIIKRVAPPDDAAALLHVEDVRGTLQQMGLFQTFTCVTRIFKTNIEEYSKQILNIAESQTKFT